MTTDALSTPPAEVEIDVALIGSLLRAQHPDLADMSIRIMEAGWDNVMVRLGDGLALRLPRRAAAEPLILNEQKWLPKLAPHLPLPIPSPLCIGTPQGDYPFHWSVLNWLPGRAADQAPPDSTEAPVLADFLRTLHALPVPANPPRNSHRDCPLSRKQVDTERRMATLKRETDLITPEVERAWQDGLVAEIDLPKSLIAGDMHARNILTNGGKISAIIDWGDMCVGDPATDLASVWALFDDQNARKTALEAYGVTAPTAARAKGWAVFFGVILAETGRKDTPRHAAMGEATLRRVSGDTA